MDNCTKLKVFNLLLLLCALNFFLYRIFSGASNTPSLQVVNMDQQGDTRDGTLGDNVDTPPGRTDVFDNSLQSVSFNTLDRRKDGAYGVRGDNTNIRGGGDRTPFQSQGGLVEGNDNRGAISDQFPPEDGKNMPRDEVVDNQQIDGVKQDNGELTDGSRPENVATTSNGEAVDSHKSELPLCPAMPPKLNGRLATYSSAKSFDQILEENPDLQPGGRHAPSTCTARHRVAIVIPFRNREEHLKILLRNLHPMLARQQLDYGIYVVDQALPGKFNRAALMNIGFVEAMKRYDYQCAIFHDVDLIPEDDRNIYSCPEQPRHLSASIDKFKYKLPYADIYGGVSAIKKDQFEHMNGFSNLYFGWGGEDDDMGKRLKLKGYHITRYPMEIARYKMIKHVHEKGNEANPERFRLLNTAGARQSWDGLSSLKYTVQAAEALPTYTRIEVLLRQEDYKTKP